MKRDENSVGFFSPKSLLFADYKFGGNEFGEISWGKVSPIDQLRKELRNEMAWRKKVDDLQQKLGRWEKLSNSRHFLWISSVGNDAFLSEKSYLVPHSSQLRHWNVSGRPDGTPTLGWPVFSFKRLLHRMLKSTSPSSSPTPTPFHFPPQPPHSNL